MNQSIKLPQHITRERGILGGNPIIRGTRIAVDDISTYLSYGLGIDEIKKAYPALGDDQIKAALDFIETQARRERQKLEPSAS